MDQDNKDRKFPAEVVLPLLLLVSWFLYSGKTIGFSGGASKVDDPYNYWAIVAIIICIILYKIVEYFYL
jgi:hypothetical protein